MNTNDAARVFDTILCAPGMSETVKINLNISRKSVLLLVSVIERGMSSKENDKPGLLESFPKDSLQELTTLAADCLQKAGLSELNEKMKSLNGK